MFSSVLKKNTIYTVKDIMAPKAMRKSISITPLRMVKCKFIKYTIQKKETEKVHKEYNKNETEQDHKNTYKNEAEKDYKTRRKYQYNINPYISSKNKIINDTNDMNDMNDIITTDDTLISSRSDKKETKGNRTKSKKEKEERV